MPESKTAGPDGDKGAKVQSCSFHYIQIQGVPSDQGIQFVDIKLPQYELLIQGVPCPRGLGFVDLDLGCSTILLGQ